MISLLFRGVGFFLLLLSVSCSGETTLVVCHKANPSQEMAGQSGSSELGPPKDPLNQLMTACQVGDFTFQVSSEPQKDQELWVNVMHKGDPLISVSGDHGTIWKKWRSIASAADKNADGAADFLSYESILDGVLTTVMLADRNLDGELETKVLMRKGRDPEIWWLVKGQWYQKIKGDGEPRVLVEGVPKRCTDNDGNYAFIGD